MQRKDATGAPEHQQLYHCASQLQDRRRVPARVETSIFWHFLRKRNSSQKLHDKMLKTKENGRDVHDMSYLFTPIGWWAVTTTIFTICYSRLISSQGRKIWPQECLDMRMMCTEYPCSHFHTSTCKLTQSHPNNPQHLPTSISWFTPTINDD